MVYAVPQRNDLVTITPTAESVFTVVDVDLVSDSDVGWIQVEPTNEADLRPPFWHPMTYVRLVKRP